MKTLIYGAGPIGRWLALRLQQAGQDVTLLARNGTYRDLNTLLDYVPRRPATGMKVAS